MSDYEKELEKRCDELEQKVSELSCIMGAISISFLVTKHKFLDREIAISVKFYKNFINPYSKNQISKGLPHEEYASSLEKYEEWYDNARLRGTQSSADFYGTHLELIQNIITQHNLKGVEFKTNEIFVEFSEPMLTYDEYIKSISNKSSNATTNGLPTITVSGLAVSNSIIATSSSSNGIAFISNMPENSVVSNDDIIKYMKKIDLLNKKLTRQLRYSRKYKH